MLDQCLGGPKHFVRQAVPNKKDLNQRFSLLWVPALSLYFQALISSRLLVLERLSILQT